MNKKQACNSHNKGPTTKTDFLQITVTAASRTEAEMLIKKLTDKRLVACAQVQGSEFVVDKGKSPKWKCRFKTSNDLYQSVCSELDLLLVKDKYEIQHSPIVKSSRYFLDWLNSEIRH